MTLYALADVSPILADETVFVAAEAVVIGNVRLGHESSVWFGAVIRGDNEPIDIGAGSNIQDGAVLHTDPGFPLSIAENCTIGHQATVHGCTIGAGSLVGMKATILNGARIGQNCLIGAGALVTEGRVVPDNSVVLGAPGKVVRDLGPDDLARLQQAAASYVERARRFARDLKPL
jgi:carbonic anhydrase/acetyltransferase-like protein (isoleucine patch superfamily)